MLLWWKRLTYEMLFCKMYAGFYFTFSDGINKSMTVSRLVGSTRRPFHFGDVFICISIFYQRVWHCHVRLLTFTVAAFIIFVKWPDVLNLSFSNAMFLFVSTKAHRHLSLFFLFKRFKWRMSTLNDGLTRYSRQSTLNHFDIGSFRNSFVDGRSFGISFLKGGALPWPGILGTGY